MSMNDEFNKLFGGACHVKTRDWNQDRFFDPTSKCYEAETALISSLTSEAFGQYGVKVKYYVKKISTKDKVYGEDPLDLVERYFILDMYMESVPSLSKTYEIQGMRYDEFVHIFATIQHFEEASRYNSDRTSIKYESIQPKIGDIIQLSFNEVYYEVIDVKKFSSNTTFLQQPITYEFTLREWRNNHEDLADDEMPIGEFANLAKTFNLESTDVSPEADMFSINDEVENDKEHVDNHPDIVIEIDHHVNDPDFILGGL